VEETKKLGPGSVEPIHTPVTLEMGRTVDWRSLVAEPAESQVPESLLVEYYRLFARHRWFVFGFASAGMLATLLFCMAARPIYRARASLDIQNLNADFMNMRNVAPTGQVSPASPEVYIQTEIKLLQSDSLRNRTVKRLAGEAAQRAAAQSEPFGAFKRALHLPAGRPVSGQELLDSTARSLTVKPLGLTRLVEVTCQSWDAQFAAEFCNALITEFQQQDREVRWTEAQKTSEWLSRQLADVREQLAKSEQKLQHAAEGNGLLFSQQNMTVGEEKLRELQSELMRAQAERVSKQAQYEISRSAGADSLPIVLDDSQLRDFQSRLMELRRQLADLVPPLTDAHPKVQHVKAQIAELETTLTAKKANVVDRMRNEFEAARQRENLLTAAYTSQEKRVSQDLGRGTQVSMLRREVEAGQQLYQTLLQRVKEAGFASAMQASTIRVVDAAQTASFPIAPQRPRSIAAGLILGAVLGVLLAFYRERTQTVLRVPGDAPRFLNVRELGVIPSARIGLSQPYVRNLMKPAGESTALTVAGAPRDQVVDLATWKAHASLVAEAYRSTTFSILREGQEFGRGRAYVITSPNAGEGKTTVTLNLGIALAQANKRVLVVDCDLRRPRLHKSMAIPNDMGLRDILRGALDFKGAALDSFYHVSEVPNLYIMPSGSGSEESSALLYSSRLKSLLDRLVEEFDVILMDSPPMLYMADARIVAGITDGAILVLRARSTDRKAAITARNLFLSDRIRMVGTILNDFDPAGEGEPNYYSAYYQYQSVGNEAMGGSR
jgi:polysaccharide biosynthesis transport protein